MNIHLPAILMFTRGNKVLTHLNDDALDSGHYFLETMLQIVMMLVTFFYVEALAQLANGYNR